jgi:spore maturation protein CgeB
MRILLAWPGHKFSTWDVADGYEKALKRLGHEVRSFDYHNRINFYAEALHHFSEVDRGFRRRGSDALIMASESIILEAVEFVPDVVLLIHGMQLHRRAYDLLHQLRLPVVMLLTESPYLDDDQIKIANLGNAAGLLANDLFSVERLSDETDLPVAYLPHSFDKERHHPRPTEDYFQTDIFFQGTLFQERQELFISLAELIEDYDIHIGGIIPYGGAEIDVDDFIPNREVAQYYANAKIALNQHRTTISVEGDEDIHIKDGTAYSIGPRAYEIAACGAFQISDGTRPELHKVFNGHIPTYQDGAELLEMVKYYLTHDEEREQKAYNAMEAVQGCSFDDRAKDIVIPFLTEVTNGSPL